MFFSAIDWLWHWQWKSATGGGGGGKRLASICRLHQDTSGRNSKMMILIEMSTLVHWFFEPDELLDGERGGREGGRRESISGWIAITHEWPPTDLHFVGHVATLALIDFEMRLKRLCQRKGDWTETRWQSPRALIGWLLTSWLQLSMSTVRIQMGMKEEDEI